ncbi:hypothetical protein J2S30_002957 [Herbaspirillum rubrisubalbicans]|uniref:hypothetical protein n=1 Tax=Herbaspirillum rubrisubalbicans TaxID=80842 RepID=UPI00209CDABE|nr:hypothetical protein [Herbaspirillum rubrisubalbicans]MCP1574578.1 hypothetical protein [Herbaspirillum rubrisubalbicans]
MGLAISSDMNFNDMIHFPGHIDPQEIYLLERYTSATYLGQLRDSWQEMLDFAESHLQQFMQHLAPDYRNRALPERPDIVWGEQVLPNFRDTFDGLCAGYIKLSHGDVDGLDSAHGVRSDFKGQLEFSAEWMGQEGVRTYRRLLSQALLLARNIISTQGAYWSAGTLSPGYTPEDRGPLDAPDTWPTYRLDPAVTTQTGQRPPTTGIYVPDQSNSSAQFLRSDIEAAPECSIFLGMESLYVPGSSKKYGEQALHQTVPCTWTLVKRMAPASLASARR